MIAAYPQPPAHPADEGAKAHSTMTQQELLIEAKRLHRLVHDRNGELLESKLAFQNMLKDLSIPIFAHMNGDTDRVRAGLDAIVNKYVTVTGDLH